MTVNNNLKVLLNTNPKNSLLEYRNGQFYSVGIIRKTLKVVKHFSSLL